MLDVVLNHCDDVEATGKICLMLFSCKVKMEGRGHILYHVCQFAEKSKDGKLVLSLQKLLMFLFYLNNLIELTN